MIVSMTGFGKSVCRLQDKALKIEIRSLNSKNLDLSVKTPSLYREYENVVRNIVGSQLERGKVEVVITLEQENGQAACVINKPLLIQYFKEIKQVAQMMDTDISDNFLPDLLRLPEVLKSANQEPDPTEWPAIEDALKEAIAQLVEFRRSEGEHMSKDILMRENNIRQLLEEIIPWEKDRVSNIKDRIYRSLKEVSENVKVDENRFEQEVIFYLEKLDITEEKVRLNKHLDYFRETLQDAEAGGKKLGFIGQEIGREINTIGSKANHAEIQKLVVQMKDELEKIKEQLMNVL